MSDRTLKWSLVALTLLGVAISVYLTYIHYAGVAPICTAGGGCETVQQSSYAMIMGLPVAVVGLVGDIAILATILMRPFLFRYATFLLALIALGFSLYLTYLELFVIHAICQWCVGHAVIVVAVLILATLRILRVPEGQDAGLNVDEYQL